MTALTLQWPQATDKLSLKIDTSYIANPTASNPFLENTSLTLY